MTIHVDATEPYAWPFDGRLAGDHVALVLAGWDDGWAGRAHGAPQAASTAASVAAAVAAVGGSVIAVAHGGSSSLPDLVTSHDVVRVPGIDAFHAGPLDAVLRSSGRTHLLVAGHGLEGPVHSTLRSANDRGYECLLVTDACSALVPELAEASAATVTMSGGIFGAVGLADAVLFAFGSIPSSAGVST